MSVHKEILDRGTRLLPMPGVSSRAWTSGDPPERGTGCTFATRRDKGCVAMDRPREESGESPRPMFARADARARETLTVDVVARRLSPYRKEGRRQSPGVGGGGDVLTFTPCDADLKSWLHLGHTTTPCLTSVPQTGQGRRFGRVTSQSIPRITSTNAHRKRMIAAPIPAPTAVPALPASQRSFAFPTSAVQSSA